MIIIKQINETIQALADNKSNMDRIEVEKYIRVMENAKTTIENLDEEIREMQRS